MSREDVIESLTKINGPVDGYTPRFEDLDIGTFDERKSKKEYKNEEICRKFLERYYGVKFPSVRPNFLKNPMTGRNLELDGYCQNITFTYEADGKRYKKKIKLAFEYNGEQHYTYPNYFHRTSLEFKKQIARDQFKIYMCNKLDIYLITIPYTIKSRDIPKFIKSRLPHIYKSKKN